ncbi:MAG: hypothetical protein IPK15_19040 [Verrucomicrobia bacterium]|nr:hypothetical protein [Verrucomicrobiota bacterium]
MVATYTMDAGTPEPADFQMNLYTITPFGTQSHDRNGNRVALNSPAGQMHYTYDFADRLVLVQRAVALDLIPVVSFTYDALGRRLSKTVYPNAPALPVTTQFILDPDSDEDVILEERVDGVAQAFAIWPHMHQRGNGIRISPSGETLYTHSDELGTAVALTDAGGNVVERYDYDEFGAPRFFDAAGVPLVNPMGQPTTASLAGNHYLFQGHFWDGETGLYLSPETSSSVGPVRWMAPESIRAAPTTIR